MPISSFTDARNEIVDHFVTAWVAQTPPVPALFHQDKSTTPPDNAPFARIQVLHNIFDQRTLGETGCRRFRRFGIITVEVFTLGGEGLSELDIFAKVALDAFEGTKTGQDRIEFRNVRMSEVGQDGPWFNATITADFDYDEIK